MELLVLCFPPTSRYFLRLRSYYSPQALSVCGEFEVLTALMMKSTVFWVISQRSSERGRRLDGTYCLHLQGRRVSQAGVLLGICSSKTSGSARTTGHYNL